jgi:TonB family protein
MPRCLTPRGKHAGIDQAQALPAGSQLRTRQLETAAALYKRAFALPGDDVIKATAIERLLIIFDSTRLNNPAEMMSAFRELIRLKPTEIDPLFRYGKYETLPGTPDKNGVYQVGGGVIAPRRYGNAAYPPDALAAGLDGSVVAEITVNEAGVVTDARVLNSIPLLDDAALKAVREWRYDPTVVDGKAVPVKMTVTVNFSTRQR